MAYVTGQSLHRQVPRSRCYNFVVGHNPLDTSVFGAVFLDKFVDQFFVIVSGVVNEKMELRLRVRLLVDLYEKFLEKRCWPVDKYGDQNRRPGFDIVLR